MFSLSSFQQPKKVHVRQNFSGRLVFLRELLLLTGLWSVQSNNSLKKTRCPQERIPFTIAKILLKPRPEAGLQLEFVSKMKQNDTK